MPAEQLSLALGRTVRYVNIVPSERTRALIPVVPSYIADALDVQASEQRKGATGEGVVHLKALIALGIRPTAFAEFARRNAAELGGGVVPS